MKFSKKTIKRKRKKDVRKIEKGIKEKRTKKKEKKTKEIGNKENWPSEEKGEIGTQFFGQGFVA